MEQNSTLKIYQKYLDLIDYSNNLVKKFPKSETFALCSEIKNSLYKGLKYLMYGIKTYNKQEKINHLKNLDVELCLIKVQCRFSYKYKYISTQNYSTWCNHITDLCNMLGGWINSCQKN